MTTAASHVQSRVTIVAPRTRIDVALPLDLTVGELLPMVLDMVGERDDPGTEHDGWTIAFDDGRQLEVARTLRSLDVLDGTLLRLVPRGNEVPPIVYDDVIDAIAKTVRDRHDHRSARSVTGAAIAGTALVLGALVLFYRTHQFGNAVLVLAATAAIIAAAAAVDRAGERLLGVTLATVGSLYAVVTGVVLIPGGYGFPGALLGFLLGLVYALCVVPLVGSAVIPLAAVGTGCFIAACGSLAGVLLPTSTPQVAAGTGCAAVAALSLLPWAVVRLAQLPLPVIPRDAEELAETDNMLGVSESVRRARVADTYYNGMVIGCALTAGLSAAVLFHAPGLLGRLLAGVLVANLLMRVRHLDHRAAKLSIMSFALVGAAIGVGATVMTQPAVASLPFFAVLFVVAVVCIAVTVLPQRQLNPLTARALDLFDGALTVALIPLAVGAMDLYTYVRHL